ncbi:MAG: phytoene/squalene synthase family protein [Gemmatimonadetes bacterium]|nr:phytoene/squalene synthase family protein [Gemmatimonadota bacterium]
MTGSRAAVGPTAPVAAPGDLRAARAWAHAILPDVSRTFALSIRFLPGTLGTAVSTAYLLCRIADTVEDDGTLSAARKAELLDAFRAALDTPNAAAKFAAEARALNGDRAHVALSQGTDRVYTLLASLPAATRERVTHWVAEMISGMRKFVLLYPDGIRMQTLGEYREYCYYVAGTVGRMLTDLWRLHAPGISDARFAALSDRCEKFGEALQTVNILKDIAWDAEHENAIYIPARALADHGSGHATILDAAHAEGNARAVAEFIDLAWRDLDEALEYVFLVPRRAIPVRAFCVLPLLYAYATLRDLAQTRAMLRAGGVVKISRREVRWLMFCGLAALWSNTALGWIVRRVRARPFAPLAVSSA